MNELIKSKQLKSVLWCLLLVLLWPFSDGSQSLAKGQYLTAASSEALNSSFYSVDEYSDRIPELQRIVSVAKEDATIKEVLEEIVDEAGLGLAYNAELNTLKEKISVNLQFVSVSEALQKVLQNTNYEASISKTREIVLHERQAFTQPITAVMQQKITGTVTDAETGEPLPGVNVVVPGTSVGTSTDANGEYEIFAPDDAETLSFSFIGYSKVEVSIDGRSEVNVALNPEVQAFEEMVVTAFGVEQEEKALGYSVQEVTADELAESSESNIVGSLQGKIAGVNIKKTSGTAGGGVDIVIRGITSLSPGANNQPLFVVDGIPVSNETVAGNVLPSAGTNSPGSAEQFSFSNRAADINPDDIESISILKGPSATVLYGLRAANGAVVITTKKGQAGRTAVNFKSSVGFEEVGKTPEIQDEYATGYSGTLHDESFAFWQFGPPATGEVYNNFEELFRTGTKYSNALSVSGGNETATYFSSFSNESQEGITPNTDWGRTTFRLGGSLNISDKMDVTGSVNYANSGGTRPTGGDKSIMSSLSYWPSTFNVNNYLNEDGSQFNPTAGIIDNPRYFAEKSTLEDNVDRVYGNVGFNYNFTDWLTLEYKLGLDYYNDERNRFVPPNLDVGTQVNGFLVEETISDKELNSNLFVRAQRNFSDKLRGNFVVGNQVTASTYERLNVRGEGLNIPNFKDLSNTTNLFSNKSASERRLVGVFADAQFDYDGTYFFTLTGRNDWSSTLPEDNRSFFYPSVSASYIFTEDLDFGSFLDYGKLRASWAKVGKDAPPYVVGQYFVGDWNFPFDGVGGFRKDTQAGSQDLKPETTTSYEFGTDLRFFGNRLGIEATYFQQSSKDQIVDFPVSNPSGLSRYYTNAGEIESNGIELLVTGTPVQTQDFSWDLQINWSKINNEVISMPEGLDVIEFANSGWAGVVSRLEKGGSPGDLYGYTFDYNDQGELLIDENTGLPSINVDTLVHVGNALPIWEGGITNTFSYKGLSLSFLLEVKHGGDVYDASQRNSLRNGILKLTETRDEQVIFNGVNSDGSTNTTPARIGQNFYRSSYAFNRASEILVQDASWIRLRNVNLRYRLPHSVIESMPVQGINFTVTGNNLFLNTPYRGFDPEGQQYSAGTNTFGFTGLNIPPTKSVTFGVNIDF